MFRRNIQSILNLVGTALVASSLLTTGCGRDVVNPLSSDTQASEATRPAPGDEVPAEDGPSYDEPADISDSVIESPAPRPASAPASRPAAKIGSLKPLPAVTPTPGPGKAGGGSADPEEVKDAFVKELIKFGYQPGNAQNVRLQVLPLLRVPAGRLHWATFADNTLTELYGKRREALAKAGAPLSFEQWQGAGLGLARRMDNVSFYVSRADLYTSIFQDRYSDNGGNKPLVFFKRLNRTGYMVSYRADGTITDYGHWSTINWSNFLAVPAAFMK